MICRIQNLSQHRLALDLRGGGVLCVEPNQISPPLREELLYDNVHLSQWITEGMARRIASHPGELQEHQDAVEKQAKADAQAACEADARATAAAVAAGAGKSTHSSQTAKAEKPEEPEDDEDSEKRPKKKSMGKAGKE